MIVTWQFFTLLAGFFLGFGLYEKFKIRLGGVVIIPLLAIYFVEYPATLGGVIISSALTLALLEVIYSRYLVYGRRLLYVSLMVGMSVMAVVFEAMGILSFGWYALLIPGLLAYNAHREYNSSTDFLKSVSITAFAFVLLIGVAVLSMYLLL